MNHYKGSNPERTNKMNEENNQQTDHQTGAGANRDPNTGTPVGTGVSIPYIAKSLCLVNLVATTRSVGSVCA